MLSVNKILIFLKYKTTSKQSVSVYINKEKSFNLDQSKT